jgi:uncharacterized protein
MADPAPVILQKKLIAALSAALGTPSAPVQVFETHISWVVVAGAFAYKFKKALRFAFLDFSMLESRRFYCQEELRLNTRTAPDIYLNVVAITGEPEQPVIDGTGEVIEYAVRMRAFEQQALWNYRLENKLLAPEETDALADKLAQFHAAAAIAPPDARWCTPAALQTIADGALTKIAELAEDPESNMRRIELERWSRQQQANLSSVFMQRKASGSIRECHGDLHCGNILTTDGQVEAFDCIEFNEDLRWIDVMNDIAFICMDLRFRQRPDLAARLLNRYLELGGDYGGLPVLRYYEVHRALIRCEVALLHAAQLPADIDEATSSRRQAAAYLSFAMSRIAPAPTALVITHGFSGCGKSTFARRMVEELDAIQLRSDVERKRMHGIAATARGEEGLYREQVSEDTYARLRGLASQVLKAGWPVIVDATFLKSEQRRQFQELAATLGIPFFILDVQASAATMKARITKRLRSEADASDAGLDVLAHQMAEHEPLSAEEMRHVVVVDAESGVEQAIVESMRRLFN